MTQETPGLVEALERLAAKWDGMDTPGWAAPSSLQWANGVDSGYSTAASELRALLAEHPESEPEFETPMCEEIGCVLRLDHAGQHIDEDGHAWPAGIAQRAGGSDQPALRSSSTS